MASLERVRAICMALPHATENIQWGRDLCFKIGGKMFCVANTEQMAQEPALSFKTTPEEFLELCEREGVIPAPYMARNYWVSLMRWNVLPASELQQRLSESYELVFAKLPKRTQAELTAAPATRESPSYTKTSRKKSPAKRAAKKSPSKKKRAHP